VQFPASDKPSAPDRAPGIAPDNATGGLAILLSQGFRAFFLLAGLYGAGALLFWIAVIAGGAGAPGGMPPVLWHGHEMIYGFAAAAAAGFLLTAVPNWTRTPPIGGWRLKLLVGLWILGRVAFGVPGGLPAALAAALDLAFLPVLALFVGSSIIASRQWRNAVFVAFMVLLFAGNLIIHLDVLGIYPGGALKGLRLGLFGFVLMLSVLGGRLAPNFTAGALRAEGKQEEAERITTHPVIDKISLLSVLAVIILDLADATSALTGTVSALAALALVLRMKDWKTLNMLGQPIVWVLHLGHFWLAAGFAMLALSHLTGLVSESAVLHAFTTGAMGTMILGVMSRAALGHTGHPLAAPPAIVWAYGLVSLSALLRIVGGISGMDYAETMVLAAGVSWVAAFVLFSVTFAPILLRPRR